VTTPTSRPVTGNKPRLHPPALVLRLPLRWIRSDLREMSRSRRAFREVSLEPAQSRLLVLRRTALGVEMDELQEVFERQVREFASGVLGQPQNSALDRSAKADVSVGLGGHERMFAESGRTAPSPSITPCRMTQGG
jgi:hypothetical protein